MILLIGKIIVLGILIWALYIAFKIDDKYGILGHLCIMGAILLLGKSIFLFMLIWIAGISLYVKGLHEISKRNDISQ